MLRDSTRKSRRHGLLSVDSTVYVLRENLGTGEITTFRYELVQMYFIVEQTNVYCIVVY